jgi:hypothetical protein
MSSQARLKLTIREKSSRDEDGELLCFEAAVKEWTLRVRRIIYGEMLYYYYGGLRQGVDPAGKKHNLRRDAVLRPAAVEEWTLRVRRITTSYSASMLWTLRMSCVLSNAS